MSPYENRLASENFRRVGLITLVPPGQDSALGELAASPPSDLSDRLAAIGLANLNLFLRRIEDQCYLFLFAEFSGTDVETVPELLGKESWFASLSPHLTPHPRATPAGQPWTRMELMNVIGPTRPAPTDGESCQRIGLMSGLHPEKELWYRTLHQTNWPGVVDQMFRSHVRYWVTFQIEFGEKLLLFTYSEYLGTDKAADDAAMAADPVTQRWWTHTNPCLYAPAADGDVWTAMPSLLEFK